jgi:hypothetical protein
VPDPGRAAYQWREDKKLSASEQAAWRTASVEAQGRLLLAVCAQLGRQSGVSGPDVARSITDTGTALQVMDSAGSGARQLAARWREDVPAAGPAQRRSSSWAGSPDHDPRVTRALLTGASDADLARIRAEVQAEYAGLARQKAARADAYYGRDNPAALGVSTGPGGVPVQQSVTHYDVQELGEQ